MNCEPIYTAPLTEEETRFLNPLVLAYVGDAVHSLYVRCRLASSSDAKVGALEAKAVKEVSAVSQSAVAERLSEFMNEAESDVYRRARNAKPSHFAKNANEAEYKRATGFEALIGYLYLSGNRERLEALFDFAANGAK
ncbi:MAG: Mini-ribonuclease 3 [Clostridiales bacterium]|jgi:ribonuclease-3 family protein|nr:Mini-ribonuclease 3 [Clostridiales bacterium]